MGVVPFSTSPPHLSVVFTQAEFKLDGSTVLIMNPDIQQFDDTKSCNATYDLRVGDKFKDHRNDTVQALNEGECIELLPRKRGHYSNRRGGKVSVQTVWSDSTAR